MLGEYIEDQGCAVEQLDLLAQHLLQFPLVAR